MGQKMLRGQLGQDTYSRSYKKMLLGHLGQDTYSRSYQKMLQGQLGQDTYSRSCWATLARVHMAGLTRRCCRANKHIASLTIRCCRARAHLAGLMESCRCSQKHDTTGPQDIIGQFNGVSLEDHYSLSVCKPVSISI